MRLRDLIFLVGSNLKRMKLRLALTALGVVIGTSAIVLMLSLGIGLRENLTQELGGMGQATDITVYGGGMMEGSEPKDLDAKAIEEFEAMEHVKAVVPSAMLQTLSSVKYKRGENMLNVHGIPSEGFEELGHELARGRWPRAEDEIAIGADVGESITDGSRKPEKLTSEDLLGKRLVGEFVEQTQGVEGDASSGESTAEGAAASAEPRQFSQKLRVVGVLEDADQETNQTTFMDLDAVLEYNGTPKRKPIYEQVTVRADSVKNVEAVEKALNEQGFGTFSARSVQESLNQTFMILQAVLGALGAIAMLVASLGIANTMTMSIFERTREIGIMKALGASNRQVKRIFLAEAAVIGVLGGLGGLALSASGAALANLFVSAMVVEQMQGQGAGSAKMQQFFMISPTLAIFAIVFAAGIGLLAGVLPAVRAANLDPLAALRHE